MTFFPRTTQSGFTLMEVMVAVSIFAIVVTVGIVSLLTINNAYRKSQDDRQAVDSLTYMLESMSRRIRTAASWDGVVYDGTATDTFSITDQNGIMVTYRWDGTGKIFMDIINPSGSNNAVADGTYDLTPDRVSVTDQNGQFPGGGLRFLPLKSTGGQSYVQINLGGLVSTTKQTSQFTFQTGVSKRVLDTQ